MSLRIDTAELIAGALVIGDVGLGVRGDAIPPAGLHGASYLANDADPGDEAKEFRGHIVTPPAVGTFFAWEDGTFTLTGAPDGSYTFSYRLFVDGVDLGTATATVLVGGVTGVVGSAAGVSAVVGTGSVSGVVTTPQPGSITGTAGGSGAVVGIGSVGGTITNPLPAGITGSAECIGSVAGVGAATGVVSSSGDQPTSAPPGFTLLAPEDQTANIGGFDFKDPLEEVTIAFEFKRRTTTPLSPLLTLAQVSGPDDDNTAAMLFGPPAVVGSKVLHRVRRGVHGANYLVRCIASAPNGDVYVMSGVLPVKARSY